MKKLMNVLAVWLVWLAWLSCAFAQTYPVDTPTYIPTAIENAVTFTAAGDFVFNTNGVGTVYIRVAGSGTGIAATPQITESRAAAPAWTNVSAFTAGLGPNSAPLVSTITATGLYRIPAVGVAAVRIHLTAVTGSISISASGSIGVRDVVVAPYIRASYSGAASIATGATTHFLSIAGSATKIVRITHAECSGRATAALAVGITAELDSTADTVDAGTAVTLAPHDSANGAATATMVSHTTSPTSGTLIGVVRGGTLSIVNAATPVYQSGPLSWDFGIRPGAQEIVLRGVAQSFSLNTSAAFGSGAAVNCAIEETEE